MHAMAMPRGPRPDFTFVLLVSILLAAGIAFFTVCAEAHASSAYAQPTVVGGYWATFDKDGLQVRGTIEVNDDLVVTHRQLDAFHRDVDPEVGTLLLDRGRQLRSFAVIVTAASFGTVGALGGAALATILCSWAFRRYAIIGVRARRWAREARAELESGRAQQARSIYR